MSSRHYPFTLSPEVRDVLGTPHRLNAEARAASPTLFDNSKPPRLRQRQPPRLRRHYALHTPTTDPSRDAGGPFHWTRSPRVAPPGHHHPPATEIRRARRRHYIVRARLGAHTTVAVHRHRRPLQPPLHRTAPPRHLVEGRPSPLLDRAHHPRHTPRGIASHETSTSATPWPPTPPPYGMTLPQSHTFRRNSMSRSQRCTCSMPNKLSPAPRHPSLAILANPWKRMTLHPTTYHYIPPPPSSTAPPRATLPTSTTTSPAQATSCATHPCHQSHPGRRRTLLLDTQLSVGITGTLPPSRHRDPPRTA